jgi:tRNA threonylcarbamoyladenosine modification (KEOPS) complex  Pcc1 subunit
MHSAHPMGQSAGELNMTTSDNDMKTARATYAGFLGMIKVAMPIIALIAVLVIYLLSH